MLAHMDLFAVPVIPGVTGTPSTPDAGNIAGEATPAAANDVMPILQAAANISDAAAPMANSSALTEVIEDGAVAKANANGHWALINLLAAIATVLIAAVMAFLGFRKNEDDENEETNRKTIVRVLGVITAAAAVIAFILTENMSLPMQLTDSWTLMMIIILAVEAVAAIASKKTTEDNENDRNAEPAMI